MLKKTIALLFILISITAFAQKVKPDKQSKKLLKVLKAIPNVVKAEQVEAKSHFQYNFEIEFRQQVDPETKDGESFNQRVILGYSSPDAPVICVLEGYQIYSEKASELADLFQCNQITIEHRFFGASIPEGELPWNSLTTKNAAYDQHVIIQALRKALFQQNKFLTTGISKGGQTTMLHRTLYPNDVNASVCYVAPLNFSRADQRIHTFLNTVSTKENRQRIFDFQTYCLQNKKALVAKLDSLAKVKNYTWSFSVEEAFEYYVLEYSFAFWQWGGYSIKDIPNENVPLDSTLQHVLDVSGVSFFEDKGVEKLRPFFWAGMTEIGVYDYDYQPFKQYLSRQENYGFDFIWPNDSLQKDFDPDVMKRVNAFIQEDAMQMMFIHGELDTWSATSVELSEAAQQRGLRKYTCPNSHHGTRIKHFSPEVKQEMIEKIAGWLETETPQINL